MFSTKAEHWAGGWGPGATRRAGVEHGACALPYSDGTVRCSQHGSSLGRILRKMPRWELSLVTKALEGGGSPGALRGGSGIMAGAAPADTVRCRGLRKLGWFWPTWM